MEKIKKTAKKVTEITLYVVFAIMFICGVCFIADQLNIVSQKVYADTPKEITLPSVSSSPRIDYTKVYAYGKYYIVFYSCDNSYGISDIEVIGPVN
jgi:hypothetical protein